MDRSVEYLKAFIGQPAAELPTPSLLLSRPVLEKNTSRLLEDVKAAGIGFRAHVKTLKCVEVVRMMLGEAHTGVVVSTLREIRGLLPLVKEGVVNEILYGLPCYPGALMELYHLSKEVKILLMVDNEAHVDILESFNESNKLTEKWRVFVKVDMGTRRAGIDVDHPRLKSLIHRIEKSSAVSIHGFYCHAGHSYSTTKPEDAASILHDEVSAAVTAAAMMASSESVVLSVGATPTAHVIRSFKEKLPERLELELHAGNYPANDLQQVATGSVNTVDQAIRLIAEVCSVYPERNEAIINAGVVALARESGPIPGFARVVSAENWNVGRLSQEHGILVRETSGDERVEDRFVVGQKVFLHVQHACITAAAHSHYFVVDGQDIVRDVWYCWKGW